ncbi:glutamate mutase L [Symbioplanes lichenis]|uniref:glutamate mutase L n=1 Tax=Symbioplanes lichenis TaxID=1629072 RepID=UPI0027391641|nr:glutamate mutase L [Actinoplanes lichenis]
MSGGFRLLADVGSTTIKLCPREPGGRFGPVERIPRVAGLGPGRQIRDLMARRSIRSVRVCSSARAGLRVGIVALSGRYSAAAARRAVVEGGGHVVYTTSFAATGPPPPVDVLVLAGGVDGGDTDRLRAALAGFDPARHPHGHLLWAGARDLGLPDGLRVDRRLPNVLDQRLRPSPGPLAEAIRDLHLRDLVDGRALRPLSEVADGPIVATPDAVGRAVRRPAGPGPLLVLDVGGTTTDVFVSSALPGAGPAVTRHVFTDLGVAASAPVMVERLAAGDELLELSTAVAPGASRSLFRRAGTGSSAELDPSERFLICVYLALRRVVAARQPGAGLTGAAELLITGGAWPGTPAAAVRRVAGLAGEPGGPRCAVRFDEDYLMWARGLDADPA